MSEKCEIDTHEMCCNRNLQNLIEKKPMGMNEWMVGWLAYVPHQYQGQFFNCVLTNDYKLFSFLSTYNTTHQSTNK